MRGGAAERVAQNLAPSAIAGVFTCSGLTPSPTSRPREAAKERRARDEPEREGRRELAPGAEDAGDDSFLDQELSVDG